MRADDDVDPRGLALDETLILLRQAARDHDPQVGVRVLQRLQVAQVPVQPVVGVLADRAGVQHDDARLVEVLGGRHAVSHQDPADPLGVVLVHLAPEGAKQVLRFHGSDQATRAAPATSRTRWPGSPAPR
jgi:hypothetical protein